MTTKEVNFSWELAQPRLRQWLYEKGRQDFFITLIGGCMGFKLTKREVDKLGVKFAEMLLYNTAADPAKLPGLATSKDWKKALPHERKQAISEIAQKARAALLECGYNKEAVEKRTAKHIRY